MRFISMHKATKEMEAGAPPSPAVLAGMGPLMEEMMRLGIFRAGEGLRPSAEGVRLTFSGGTRTITPGPFTGTNELIDRYLIVRVASIDEAIEWATRFAGADDGEIDVRPVTESWDLGFAPKPPKGTPSRFMILHKSDETRAPRNPVTFAPDADVILAGESIQPSVHGVRLKFRDGNRTIVDGPFTESKELIAGFSITELPSIDEAIQWASRFAALFDELEIDIRPLDET
jgi:hypothetical protein